MSSTQFDGDIDSFVSYLKSNRGLSANTLKAYRADLTACLHLFELRGVTDLNEITLDDLRSWMAVESRDHARSSMARKTVAVRGFFAWTYEHGLTTTDPAATLMTPSIPSTLPAVLTESQAEQLLDVAEHAVATNQYKDDGGAAAAPGSGKAAGKTADKSADTVNRSETPARADKRDNARVTAESQRNAANCCMPPASVSPNWCRWISPTSTSPIAPSKSPAKATSNAWCRSDYPPSVRWRLGWNRGGRYWPVRQRMQSSPVLPTPCSSAHEAAVSTNA